MLRLLPLFLLLPVLFAGAHAESRGTQSGCHFPDAVNHRAPAWICQPGSSRGLVSEVGYARPSSAGFNFNHDMAVADARIKLARRLQGQCGRRGESNAVLRYSRVLNLQRSPSGGFYARVGLRSADLRHGC